MITADSDQQVQDWDKESKALKMSRSAYIVHMVEKARLVVHQNELEVDGSRKIIFSYYCISEIKAALWRLAPNSDLHKFFMLNGNDNFDIPLDHLRRLYLLVKANPNCFVQSGQVVMRSCVQALFGRRVESGDFDRFEDEMNISEVDLREARMEHEMGCQYE